MDRRPTALMALITSSRFGVTKHPCVAIHLMVPRPLPARAIAEPAGHQQRISRMPERAAGLPVKLVRRCRHTVFVLHMIFLRCLFVISVLTILEAIGYMLFSIAPVSHFRMSEVAARDCDTNTLQVAPDCSQRPAAGMYHLIKHENKAKIILQHQALRSLSPPTAGRERSILKPQTRNYTPLHSLSPQASKS